MFQNLGGGGFFADRSIAGRIGTDYDDAALALERRKQHRAADAFAALRRIQELVA